MATAVTLSPLRYLPACAIVSMQVPYPLVHGHARDELTVATVVVFALVSTGYALAYRGLPYAAILVAAAGAGGFAVEVLGVRTGVPFGSYRYDAGLGPKLLGVPVVVGAAWLMMAHPCVVVAERIATAPPARIAATAVALAGWDVFLDPQMVDAGHWHWRDPSPHLPGVDRVPLSNLGGWLLVALVLGAVLVAAARRPDPDAVERPVVVLWIWVWLSSALAALVFFHRPAVAGWGLLAMGIVGVPLLAHELRR